VLAEADDRGNNYLNCIARLQPGITIARASDRMKAIVAQLRELYPDEYKESGILLLSQADAGIHPKFHSAQVALSVVLLVGSVLVVRSLQHALSVNIGFQPQATASGMAAWRRPPTSSDSSPRPSLSLAAGAAGLVVGAGVSRRESHSTPIDILSTDLRLNGTVLLFTLVVARHRDAVRTVPALRHGSLARSCFKGRRPAGGSRSRMSRPLVVAQMALSLIRSVLRLLRRNLRGDNADKGFNSDNRCRGVDRR
jgi:hypothetical protein